MTPGRIIGDKYRILELLGRGGMGVVVRAENVLLGNQVAIKFLRDDVAANIAPDARFHREARLAARLTSPHACRVIDYGLCESGPYLVMELLTGRSLSDELHEKGLLPWQRAHTIATQICDAVAEAHALHIVHRDLKPNNIFLTECSADRVHVKVLDFGAAKIPAEVITASGGPSLTDQSILLGTPAYVAPEQLENSKQVSSPADVWAIGVLLYEMLSGTLPFEDRWVPKLLTRIAKETPKPLGDLVPDCPAAFASLVMRCLEKEPKARFAHAAELGLELAKLLPVPEATVERFVLHSQPLAPPSSPPASGGRRSSPSSAALRDSAFRSARTLTRPAPIAPRRGWPGWVFAFALGTATGAGLMLLVPREPRPTPAPPRTTASPPVSDQISLEISVSPEAARLTLDGARLPQNPFRGRYSRDTSPHQLLVEADGFLPQSLPLSFDRDSVIALRLTPSPSASSTASPSPRATPARVPTTSHTSEPAPAERKKLDVTNPFGE